MKLNIFGRSRKKNARRNAAVTRHPDPTTELFAQVARFHSAVN